MSPYLLLVDQTKALGFNGDMPTIIRVGGFRFEVIPGDHTPPHTHAYYGGGRLVIYLDPIELREQVGLKPPEVAKAMRLAAEHQATLLRAWREINGNP